MFISNNMYNKLYLLCFLLGISNLALADVFFDEYYTFKYSEAEVFENKLKAIFKLAKGFEVEFKSERWFSIYFDTPELTFLNQNQQLKYQAKEDIRKKKVKKEYIKKEKVKFDESIDYLKNKQIQTYKAKHYKNSISIEEKHPLLGLVKRTERKAFIEQLQSDGITNPMRIKYIFQSSKNIHRYTLYNEENLLFSIEINYIETTLIKAKLAFLFVKFEFDTAKINNLNEHEVIELEKIVKKINDSMPELAEKVSIETTEYKFIFNKMKDDIMLFSLNLKYPIIIKMLYTLLYILLGLLVLKTLFWKRLTVI